MTAVDLDLVSDLFLAATKGVNDMTDSEVENCIHVYASNVLFGSPEAIREQQVGFSETQFGRHYF